MKKGLLVIALTVFCCLFAFSRSRITHSWVYYDNEKINITEYLLEEDVFNDGKWICKNRFTEITNKTNDDMEVKVNYVIWLYGRNRSGNWITSEKKITGQIIKLRPLADTTIAAKTEMRYYNELKTALPDSAALDGLYPIRITQLSDFP